MKTLGIALLVLGIIALAYQGISYTRRHEVLDVGGLKVETKEKKTIPLPPVLGVVAVIAGVALIVADTRGKRLL